MWRKSNLLKELVANSSAHPNPLELSINGVSLCLWRASGKIVTGESVSDWFLEQNCFPKMYFRHESTGDSHFALGSLFQVDKFPEICIFKNPYGFTPKLYGGVGNICRPSQLSIWEKFPTAIFILPQIEIEIVNNDSFIHLYFLNSAEFNKKGIVDRLSTLQEFEGKENYKTPTVIGREDFPTRLDWNRTIEKVLRTISFGKIQKVVLARQSSFTYKDPVSIAYLMDRLQKIECGTLFCIQFSSGTWFVGVTPELLYSRKGNVIEIMALAGTASLLESQNLQREKEQSEFGLVKEFIYEKMKTLCRTIESSPDITYPIASLVHLRRTYRGQLHSCSKDSEILTALHPTPAISGFPQQFAIDFLQKTESFDRGWYASPIGYISENESRMYIAIRSGLITEKVLHLFSGAGIVNGSMVEKEWEELDKKIGQFL